MKPNYYQIIRNCVEIGCRHGFSRAHKNTDDPPYDVIEICVQDAIMFEITSKFIFPIIEEGINYNEL
tara:strand:+ start:80 stop:280 length:201 start_codon:yes stop_codon:yes gene_type:complete